MNRLVKKYSFLFIFVLFNGLLFFTHPEKAAQSWANSQDFFIQMIKIFPPLFFLMGLIETWIPKDIFASYLGKKSGIKGPFLSFLMGTMAAGPLLTAFPLAATLAQKGVRTANVVIFLGAWSTLKIPMLLLESSFLGIRFALVRLVVTAPFLFLIGYLSERWAPLKS